MTDEESVVELQRSYALRLKVLDGACYMLKIIVQQFEFAGCQELALDALQLLSDVESQKKSLTTLANVATIPTEPR